MWGYYSRNAGFYLEFDYTKFPNNFLGPFPINYVENLKPIDINNYGGEITFIIQTNIKKDIWEHEDEFRFLVQPQNRDFKVRGAYSNSQYGNYYADRIVDYPKSSINAIYLGFNFLKSERIISSEKDKYKIELVSRDSELKDKLIKQIIIQSIPCYSIIQEIPSFKLNKEKWEFKRVKGKKYEILRTYT